MAIETESKRELIVAAQVHSRVLVAGSDDPTAPLLVGCHGYGENAEHHLRVLQRIPGLGDWRLAAIEALHPFYNRRSGEVVASWMTQRLRERAIADNVRYMLGAIDTLTAAARPACLAMAGFSQGVAMAYRAAAALSASPGLRADALIVLAGDVPPDVQAQASELPPILLGRGTRDDWYTEKKMQQDSLVLAGREFETFVFEGGHLWSSAFLERAGSFLTRFAHGPVLE